jgi:hypothetical protein
MEGPSHLTDIIEVININIYLIQTISTRPIYGWIDDLFQYRWSTL